MASPWEDVRNCTADSDNNPMATKVRRTSKLIVMMSVNPRRWNTSDRFKETYLIFMTLAF
jgi:hypothetical protein